MKDKTALNFRFEVHSKRLPELEFSEDRFLFAKKKEKIRRESIKR